MSHLLRKTDVLAHFGNNCAEVGRAFAPVTKSGRGLSKTAVRKWGEFVPELRARQLLDHYPALKDLVVDPITRLSAREMRARLGAVPEAA